MVKYPAYVNVEIEVFADASRELPNVKVLHESSSIDRDENTELINRCLHMTRIHKEGF